jgi:predicted metalloprotease with PDZ domain
MSSPIVYRIVPKSPEAHLFEVSCTVEDPDPEGQEFALPAWIPGSYLVREFAKHVVSAKAAVRNRPVAITKIDKHTWRCAPAPGPLTVTIEVYAWDLSVRGAHLDRTHGFFNGTSVFLRPIGRQGRPCEVEIRPPRGARYRNWRVATALKRVDAKPLGFGRYVADDYDELIDSPVEMGTFAHATFTAGGVPHEIAITGRQDADLPRLCRDLAKICEHQIRFFGKPAPMDRYVFLVMAVGDGYGGLEHRASTALVCKRDDLPRAGERAISESYRTFLGLASHEYFHTWNVKRIKPAAFLPYDLDRENYTRLLWAFEGFTSYYDDLVLARVGLMKPDEYLDTLAKAMTAVARTPGRLVQSVGESSFDTWIKFYRQDENTPNAVVNYYAKGSLVGLCLDMTIRKATRGRRSLDDVMRALWTRYGARGIGVPEDGIEAVASEIAGRSLRAFFRRATDSPEELPLAEAMAWVDVEVHQRAARRADDRGGHVKEKRKPAERPRVDFGVRLGNGADASLASVFNGGAAEAAGLAAGDVVIAIDGLRVNAKNLDGALQKRRPGDRVRVHAFRRDELFETEVELRAASPDTIDLAHARGKPGARFNQWLERSA